MKNIYMIGNTHFDPVWLWRWDEAMASIRSTFRSALDRMEEYPDFVYSFATPPVFEWIKQVDPPLFEEIKARVAEGRWELCEGWWLQPDCFSASGESYARQSLYGQRYLMENFGRYSQTVFNVDSFGHSSATPQLLQKSHMQYYCLCRPEMRHIPLDAPYFTWRSKDGSEVKAFRAGQYDTIYYQNMPDNLSQTEGRMAEAPCDNLMVYGVTNHGGAPTKKILDAIHEWNEQKPYTVRCATVSEYFEAQDAPPLTVEGELLTGDFGPYTNHHGVKKQNRLAEYAVLAAEAAAVVAKAQLNRPYPAEALTACWKDVMFNQFHDILGGASIKEAYFDARNQQGRAIATAHETMHFALQAITRQVQMPGKNPDNAWNIVVWNLHPTAYHGYIEAEVQWVHEFDWYEGGLALEDADGNRYPCQRILEGSVIPQFRSRFVFQAEIPAMGYKAFKLVQTGGKEPLVADPTVRRLTAGTFEVEFDPATGLIRQLQDTATGRTFADPLRPVCLADEGDTWCFNVEGYGARLEDFTPTGMEITEDGCHRTTVKVTYTFRRSQLTLYYTFYQNAPYWDVRYVVNWNEAHTVLKLAFDTGCEALSVSSPFCVEQRGDCSGDRPMGEWLSMEDEAGGVSLLADSLFSYTKQGTTVLLSVLRSCIYGDLRIGDLVEGPDYPIMEQGISEGTVRVVIHTGDHGQNRIPVAAQQFNDPPVVICEANHGGTLPAQHSYLALTAETALVTAVKKWEDGDGTVVRLYEYAGQPQTATLQAFGHTHVFPLSPYEIKTLLLTGNTCREIAITED